MESPQTTHKYRKVTMGTLHTNGQALQSITDNSRLRPQYDGKSDVVFGDTQEGSAITWVKPDGVEYMVADRTLLCNISWVELDRLGYVEGYSGYAQGRMVIIDGRLYHCRLLEEDEFILDDEWTVALLHTNIKKELWHWQDTQFWMRRTRGKSYIPITSGGKRCNITEEMGPETTQTTIGFRPALFPAKVDMLYRGGCLALDSQPFQFYLATSGTGSDQGMCLVLAPVQSSRLMVHNSAILSGLEGHKSLKMYTLLMEDIPVPQDGRSPVKYKPGAHLTLTDRFYGEKYLISWDVVDGLAFSTEDVLSQVSRDDLKELGFALPKEPLHIEEGGPT